MNFFHALRLQAVDGDERRTLSELGTGEQQVFALSLAYAIAHAFHEGIVLVVEEPEAHLHPLAQQWLARRLGTMARGGLQIVVTTHSAHFVDLLALDGVVLVRKNAGKTVVTQRRVTELVDGCIQRGAPRDRTTAENILPFYAAAATPAILEGFFARTVVLVEGQTESLALPILWGRLGFDTSEHSVAVIPVGGKGSLSRWWRPFECYGIPTYIVFDNDGADDGASTKRRDALSTIGVSADQHDELVASQQWIVSARFTVFGVDFESTLREFFAGYAALEANARAEGVDAKPFVARWVAERLPVEAPGDGPARLRAMIDAVRSLSDVV